MTTQSAQTVADLTIAEFRALVRQIVVEVVEELIDRISCISRSSPGKYSSLARETGYA